MKCPFCRQADTEVYNSRTTRFGTQTWRRRRCSNCSKTFTTYEAPDLTFLRIASSKTKKPAPYSRAILFSSIYDSFLSVPHKAATIDAVTDTVEAKLLDLQTPTLTTTQIAAIILATLKHFNAAAFMRYLAAHAGVTSPAELKKALRKY